MRSHPLYGLISILISFGLLWMLSHRMRKAQIHPSPNGEETTDD